MFRTILTSSTIACFLMFGIPAGSAARPGDAQNPVKAVGKATKDVAKATVKGTKKVAKKAGAVTEEAAEKTVRGTKNVGKRVEGAVTPDLKSASCRDGTVQTGKTKSAACARHGGVKK